MVTPMLLVPYACKPPGMVPTHPPLCAEGAGEGKHARPYAINIAIASLAHSTCVDVPASLAPLPSHIPMPPQESSEIGCQCGPKRFLVASCFYKRWWDRGASWHKGEKGAAKGETGDAKGEKGDAQGEKGGDAKGSMGNLVEDEEFVDLPGKQA